jgi:hypothetical protein
MFTLLTEAVLETDVGVSDCGAFCPESGWADGVAGVNAVLLAVLDELNVYI